MFINLLKKIYFGELSVSVLDMFFAGFGIMAVVLFTLISTLTLLGF